MTRGISGLSFLQRALAAAGVTFAGGILHAQAAPSGPEGVAVQTVAPSVTYDVAAVDPPMRPQAPMTGKVGIAMPMLAPSVTFVVAALDPPDPPNGRRGPSRATGDDASGSTGLAPGDYLALKTDERLLAENSGADAVPAFVQGLKITGETGKVTVVEGEAELRKRGTSVKADRITFLPVEAQVKASGNVRVYRNGDLFTGTELDLKLDAQTGSFLKAEYLLANDRARGSAARMDFLGKDNYRADDAVYTTCGPGNDDWYFQVKELKLDYGRDVGEIEGARLHFMGAHVLSLPGLSFALNSRRKSGFLAPSFGSTIQSGQELSVPYYWNIAPNRDLTITPRLMTKRGLQTNLAARYIGEDYQGEARVEWLPDDKLTRTHRSGLSILHRQNLGSGWVGDLNVNRVSDDTYFTDLSSRIAQTSQRTLIRDARVSYAAPYFSLAVRTQSYQTLQDPNNPVLIPYNRLPQIAFNARSFDVGGFELNLNADITRFSHPTQVMGNRAVVQPSISYPLLSPGAFLTPKLSFHSTRYVLHQTAAGAPGGFSRTVPSLTVDGGLVFERTASYFGQGYTQTLEPRLYYVRTPAREQSRIPVFDSGIPDLNFAQIFADNVYSGSDRIGDANQLTFGVTSRLIGADKAAERMRFAIAQRFYFTDQKVTLPGETPRTNRTSDFLAAVSGEIAPKLTLDTALQYNPKNAATARSSIGVRWMPEPGKTISAAYRYRRDSLEQVDFASQWRFGQNWYGVGRYNFSLREGRVVEALGGVEYDGGCWVGRFVLQRFATAAQRATTAIFFQVELNGLSRLGSNPLDQLRRNIPGYTRLHENETSAPKTMDRYE